MRLITAAALQTLKASGNRDNSAKVMESNISNCDSAIQTAVLKRLKSHSISHIREIALLCEQRANPR